LYQAFSRATRPMWAGNNKAGILLGAASRAYPRTATSTEKIPGGDRYLSPGRTAFHWVANEEVAALDEHFAESEIQPLRVCRLSSRMQAHASPPLSVPTRGSGAPELTSLRCFSWGGIAATKQKWQLICPLDQHPATSQEPRFGPPSKARPWRWGLHHIRNRHATFYVHLRKTQLGCALARGARPQRLLQTKVPPNPDPGRDNRGGNWSREYSSGGKAQHLHMLAIHGPQTLPEHLEQTLLPVGAEAGQSVAEQRRARIGFSISYPQHHAPNLP